MPNNFKLLLLQELFHLKRKGDLKNRGRGCLLENWSNREWVDNEGGGESKNSKCFLNSDRLPNKFKLLSLQELFHLKRRGTKKNRGRGCLLANWSNREWVDNEEEGESKNSKCVRGGGPNLQRW